MFQSIKDALNKTSEQSSGNALYNEVLKTTEGNTYTVRLLPFAKDPSKTFVHYYVHGWNSFATGQYVSAISPATFQERDPISEERFRVLRTGTEEEKEKMQAVRRTEKWLVNVYVIDDPTNPENNGKVKILRYGKQLQKIIMEAIEGEDAEEFGSRIFDLSPNGVSFKIKVEKQGDYPSYVTSRFTNAGSKINLSADEQKKIYDSVHTLEDLISAKSYDELKKMVDEHIYVKINSSQGTEQSVPVVNQQPKRVETVESYDDKSVEDEIDDLLKDL